MLGLTFFSLETRRCYLEIVFLLIFVLFFFLKDKKHFSRN